MITRGEAVQILYKTSQTNLALPAPPIVDKLNVKIDEDFNGKCAPYLEAASKLPEVILNRFDDEGWSLVIGNDFIDQWSTENKTSAAGLTHYANKPFMYAVQPVLPTNLAIFCILNLGGL